MVAALLLAAVLKITAAGDARLSEPFGTRIGFRDDGTLAAWYNIQK